jgi:undecaprenyl-diphosphatase
VVAYFAMNSFVNFLNKNGFKVFGYYRIALGFTILLLLYLGVPLKLVD